MLIDGSGRVGADIGAPAGRERTETAKRAALAIARRASDDSAGWAQVSGEISGLALEFATLLGFMRRDPPLLAAYFSDEVRVRALIERSRPAERVLARHARDLAAERPKPICELTDDERLRVRLYELSLIAGACDFTTIAAAAEALGLKTPNGITALAFLLLRMRRAPQPSPPLQLIAGWPEDRRRVFFWRYLAFNFKRRVAPYAAPAQTFRLTLTTEETTRVARLLMPGQLVAAKRNGVPLLCQTIHRASFPAARWFDISLTLPRLASMVSADFWVRLARLAMGGAKAEAYLSRPATLRLMTRRFGTDGVLHLYKHYGVRSLFEHTLENGARSSKRILKDFAARYPEILPPRILESVTALTADRDTFITLVNEYLLGREPRADSDIAAIVAAAFETPPSVMRAILQSETGRRLLTALSQFKTRHGVNLLRFIAFDGAGPASLDGLDGYIYELRNAFNLELAILAAGRGGRPVGKSAQRKLFEKTFLLEFETDRLPADKVDAARRRLRSRAVDRINALLQAQGSAHRLEREDVEALVRDWRDAEPVVTLLARLSDPARRGGPCTDAASLVLNAAKAAAQRSFMSFKFDDFHGRRQLFFLSEPQREAWMASRALVRVGGADRPGNQARLEESTRRLNLNLTRLSASAPFEPARLPPALRAEMAELASDEIKANPAEVAERALAAHVPCEYVSECARACLIDIADQLNGAVLGGFEQRNAARIMRALVRIGFAESGESDLCQDVIEHLRTIEREIPKDMLDGETISKGIVVTAFDCSPRLMMTIGDIVNTGSCLNYQNGSRINVLPAYVVDANIQALVSWQLKQSHFASVRDYKTVLNAFVAGRPANVDFDGDRLVFRFIFPEGDRNTVIDTLGLGFAHLRQIVRLGRTRKRLLVYPALLAEREYAQPHPLQPLMHANHADILRQLADELGAVDGRPIKFPPSRNPDGVYCDARGGVQIGEYVVYQQ